VSHKFIIYVGLGLPVVGLRYLIFTASLVHFISLVPSRSHLNFTNSHTNKFCQNYNWLRLFGFCSYCLQFRQKYLRVWSLSTNFF